MMKNILMTRHIMTKNNLIMNPHHLVHKSGLKRYIPLSFYTLYHAFIQYSLGWAIFILNWLYTSNSMLLFSNMEFHVFRSAHLSWRTVSLVRDVSVLHRHAAKVLLQKGDRGKQVGVWRHTRSHHAASSISTDSYGKDLNLAMFSKIILLCIT